MPTGLVAEGSRTARTAVGVDEGRNEEVMRGQVTRGVTGVSFRA
jgi:hypothetical protein